MLEKDQGSTGEKKRFTLPAFLGNRLFVIIAACLLFLAVAGGIYSLIILRNNAVDEPLAQEEEGLEADDAEGPETAEVLPQQRRDDSGENNLDGPSITFDPSIDPFSDPMRLTGTASGGRAGNMAIIESSGTSYIVTVNDYVDDLWSVREISADQVILRAHDKEVTLYLDKPPVTRSLDPVQEEEDQGEGE